jgi:ribosomal-protein-alanine acetyltransferase
VRLVVRLATKDDIPALLEIEHQSFPNQSWHAEDFLADECIVAELDGRIVGFLVSRESFHGDREDLPEREILNLAVAPPFRRMGVAGTLLRHELRHKATYFLEVRESNQAAQMLYRQFGFVEIARRQQYYLEPSEGAIVMKMK